MKTTGIVATLLWVWGIVLASGWWKLLAFLIPLYGYYKVVEHLVLKVAL